MRRSLGIVHLVSVALAAAIAAGAAPAGAGELGRIEGAHKDKSSDSSSSSSSSSKRSKGDGIFSRIVGGILSSMLNSATSDGNEWTPGGSARTDFRLYPFRPFSLDLVADASFFPHGPPLLEAQLLPGATFARLDLRAGAGLLYQPGVNPIIGPRIQIGVRF